MCLLFVYLNEDPGEDGYRMILASNRDEYWNRPTDSAAFRDNNQWMGGADLEPGKEGGTWLGISTTGKVAVLLNILAVQKPDAKGRGSLVRDFLIEGGSCEGYLDRISSTASQYNPFHLVVMDLRQDCRLHYVSHSQKAVRKTLQPGVNAADNSKDMNTAWRKREEGQALFTDIVQEHAHKDQQQKLVDSIIDLLNDKTQYFPDKMLAEQFQDVGRATVGNMITERSALFVFSPHIQYGTRTNTVILVDRHGNCEYVERTLNMPVDIENHTWNTVKHRFLLDINV